MLDLIIAKIFCCDFDGKPCKTFHCKITVFLNHSIGGDLQTIMRFGPLLENDSILNYRDTFLNIFTILYNFFFPVGLKEEFKKKNWTKNETEKREEVLFIFNFSCMFFTEFTVFMQHSTDNMHFYQIINFYRNHL